MSLGLTNDEANLILRTQNLISELNENHSNQLKKLTAEKRDLEIKCVLLQNEVDVLTREKEYMMDNFKMIHESE